jgi:hypothetical protein
MYDGGLEFFKAFFSLNRDEKDETLPPLSGSEEFVDYVIPPEFFPNTIKL